MYREFKAVDFGANGIMLYDYDQKNVAAIGEVADDGSRITTERTANLAKEIVDRLNSAGNAYLVQIVADEGTDFEEVTGHYGPLTEAEADGWVKCQQNVERAVYGELKTTYRICQLSNPWTEAPDLLDAAT